jgi:Mg2+ and Co2+ transporter CorA
MAEDIVTRLRTTLASNDDVYKTMFEAAYEIQSLRAKLALTEDEMVRMARMMSEMTESYRQLRQEYEKVRGNA